MNADNGGDSFTSTTGWFDSVIVSSFFGRPQAELGKQQQHHQGEYLWPIVTSPYQTLALIALYTHTPTHKKV